MVALRTRLVGGLILLVAASGHLPAGAGATGRIDTVAGNGQRGYSGDGGAARSAALFDPRDVAVGASGTLYIVDTRNHRVRRVEPDGRISTLAGTGTAGVAGEGGPASEAQLHWPQAVAVDPTERFVYVADTANHRIVAIDLTSATTATVAGTATGGFAGDGGPATAALLLDPKGVSVSPSGAIVVADTGNDRVRSIDPSTGVITTIAGTGTHGFGGDGGPATAAALASPRAVAFDAAGVAYLADDDNHRIRRIEGGVISTVAGTGTPGYTGDDGPATEATLANPRGVTVDGAGNVYIADSTNHVIRMVDPAGVVTTIAGNGRRGYEGDGRPAADSRLFSPRGVTDSPAGEIYVADTFNGRIRRIAIPV